MPVHLCKLLPPRPTFPADMSAAEAALMREHAAYWTGLTERGVAVAFGPVFDPAGVWGLAMDVADGASAATLTEDDPVIRSDCGFRYEIYPMPQAVVRASVQP
jgi:YCII-related domain